MDENNPDLLCIHKISIKFRPLALIFCDMASGSSVLNPSIIDMGGEYGWQENQVKENELSKKSKPVKKEEIEGDMD